MNTSLNSVSTTSILDNYVSVLKKYNDFNGRARRSEYWYFFLANVVVTQGLNLINVFLLGGSTIIAGLIMLLNLAILVPSIAVAIRRMHDVGKSGWYVLIPIYNLILACREGTKGINAYGADLKLRISTKMDLFCYNIFPDYVYTVALVRKDVLIHSCLNSQTTHYL